MNFHPNGSKPQQPGSNQTLSIDLKNLQAMASTLRDIKAKTLIMDG